MEYRFLVHSRTRLRSLYTASTDPSIATSYRCAPNMPARAVTIAQCALDMLT